MTGTFPSLPRNGLASQIDQRGTEVALPEASNAKLGFRLSRSLGCLVASIHERVHISIHLRPTPWDRYVKTETAHTKSNKSWSKGTRIKAVLYE